MTEMTYAPDGSLNVTEGVWYNTIAASQTAQALVGYTSSGGALGDWLGGVLVIPATTSPGAVSIKDGSNSAITVFTGGSTSVSNLVPFFIPIGARSQVGKWQVTTGVNVSCVAVGNFT